MDSCACHTLHKSPHLRSAVHIIDNVGFYCCYDNILTTVKDLGKEHVVLICMKTVSKHIISRNRQQIWEMLGLSRASPANSLGKNWPKLPGRFLWVLGLCFVRLAWEEASGGNEPSWEWNNWGTIRELKRAKMGNGEQELRKLWTWKRLVSCDCVAKGRAQGVKGRHRGCAQWQERKCEQDRESPGYSRVISTIIWGDVHARSLELSHLRGSRLWRCGWEHSRQATQVPIPSLLLPCCATSGKLLGLSGPPFLLV